VRRSGERAWLVVVAFAGACSSPDLTEEGFVSLGRDLADGGVAGTGGTGGAGPAISTGGVFSNGGASTSGASTGDDAGAAGTIISQGGTPAVNGGTGTGAACGDELIPFYGADPWARDSEIATACAYAGPNSRVCLPEGSVWYCGQHGGGIVEQGCPNDSCLSGCCHTPSDPCPADDADAYDCAGDCGDDGDCTTGITLAPNFVQVIRIGPNNPTLECNDRSYRYFAINFDFASLQAGPTARITVSPPWELKDAFTCDPPLGQCLVVNAAFTGDPNFSPGFVAIVTDADSPPARNVIIETSDRPLTCP
jgi:hypothetical protein